MKDNTVFEIIRKTFSDPKGLALELKPDVHELFQADGHVAQAAVRKDPATQRLEITLDEQLTLSADAFVRDPVLGSLGLIHILDSALVAPRDLPAVIVEALDQAIFLRHLLVERARLAAGPVEHFPKAWKWFFSCHRAMRKQRPNCSGCRCAG